MSSTASKVDFRTDPTQYRHWRLSFDGPVATLAMDVAEDGGLRPGYKLKLNSYDLGVDIELHDALQRIRFEHPEVRSVVVTSMKDRIFCSGANIFMLGLSSHAWKVNFCKFTNETRNGIEDSSRNSGLKFIAALNGACAGGGYELALACDEILLIDDRSSSVALPEVPLLGVLPGTGGLTRVTDKRRVRHDHADIFCTLVEGVRGQRAKDWRLVDDVVKPAQFEAAVRERARALAEGSHRPAGEAGVTLTRWRARKAPMPCPTATSTCAWTARSARPPGPCARRRGRCNRSWPTFWPPARPGGRCRWRANWTTPSCRCAPTSWTSAPGSSRPRATRRPCWPRTLRCNAMPATGSCARPPACCAARWRAWT